MRVVLKPMGVLILVGTLATLSTLLYVQSQKMKSDSTGATSVAVSATATAPSSAAPAPSATASSAGLVYTDGPQNGWEQFGWAKELNWADPANARGGRGIAISARPKNFEAIYLHHAPLDVSAYDRLTFWVHGGKDGVGGVRATVIVNENDNSPTDLTLKPFPAGRWTPVTLRLKDFLVGGAGGRPDVTGFWLMNTSGKTSGTFYIDDVRLLQPGEPDPAAEGR